LSLTAANVAKPFQDRASVRTMLNVRTLFVRPEKMDGVQAKRTNQSASQYLPHSQSCFYLDLLRLTHRFVKLADIIPFCRLA